MENALSDTRSITIQKEDHNYQVKNPNETVYADNLDNSSLSEELQKTMGEKLDQSQVNNDKTE